VTFEQVSHVGETQSKWAWCTTRLCIRQNGSAHTGSHENSARVPRTFPSWALNRNRILTTHHFSSDLELDIRPSCRVLTHPFLLYFSLRLRGRLLLLEDLFIPQDVSDVTHKLVSKFGLCWYSKLDKWRPLEIG
jgi:hypothetical protein